MHRIIAGGTGLIGGYLIEHWLKQGHSITVVGRLKSRIESKYGDHVKALSWDKLTSAHLQSAELIINLTGASIGDKRWTEVNKKEIINSRIGSTKKISQLLCELKTNIPLFLNASAIGIYGLQSSLADRLPPALDEDTEIDWDNPSDFLSQVARRWEKAADPAIAHGARVIFLRFGVVLAKRGGALPKLMQIFRYYLGGAIGSGTQPFSWISIDDLIRAVDFLISQPDLSGPFNLVAPDAVMQHEVADTLSRVMDKPDIITMPAFVLKYMLGEEKSRELLLQGQRVYPKRLLQLGFKFSYPDIESAINHVINEKISNEIQGKQQKQQSWMMKVKNLLGKDKK